MAKGRFMGADKVGKLAIVFAMSAFLATTAGNVVDSPVQVHAEASTEAQTQKAQGENNEETKGQLNIRLKASDEELAQYSKEHPDYGNGIYVFVQSIDTNEIYRLPIDKSNIEMAYFPIKYGNYKVIQDPDAGFETLNVVCDNVFSISEKTQSYTIDCSLRPKASAGTEASQGDNLSNPDTNANANSQKDMEGSQGKNTVAETAEKDSGVSSETIFTIVMAAIMAGLCAYRRFVKWQR